MYMCDVLFVKYETVEMFKGVLSFSELNGLKPKNATAKIKLLGEYDPQKELIIEDPYYVSKP